MGVVIGMPIQDQRTMHGDGVQMSVGEVEQFWAGWARHKGFRMQPPPPDSGLPCGFALVEREQLARAFVSDNRWVADCVNCGGGIACWTDNPRGCCLDCGSIYQIIFPTTEVMDAAVSVLELRPEMNRNWDPAFETPVALAFENVCNGDPLPAGVELPAELAETAAIHAENNGLPPVDEPLKP
jgi:hypothetical protein